jgi:hypothetical protein
MRIVEIYTPVIFDKSTGKRLCSLHECDTYTEALQAILNYAEDTQDEEEDYNYMDEYGKEAARIEKRYEVRRYDD